MPDDRRRRNAIPRLLLTLRRVFARDLDRPGTPPAT
jgi:hypothetical protein